MNSEDKTMRLLFSELASARYKRWKRQAGDSYNSLKSVILSSLESPQSGLGSPYQFMFNGTSYHVRTFGCGLFLVYTFNADELKIEALSGTNDGAVTVQDGKQHDAVIGLMRRFMDDGKAKLGIFWYDYSQNVLFGVEKGDAELYQDQGRTSTYPKLHKTYWQKMHRRALANGDKDSIFYNENDYTKIPRGRIFLEDGIFYVNVGDWINGMIGGTRCIDKEKLRELIVDEFNIPDDFVFRQDVHWNIGHGWSEEQL